MDYKSLNRIKISITVAVLLTTLATSSFGIISVNAQPDLIDPSAIPKFVNQLTSPPPVYVPKLIANPAGTGVAAYYEVIMSKTMQQVLPTVDEDGNPTGFNPTEVWGYGGQAQDALTKKTVRIHC